MDKRKKRVFWILFGLLSLGAIGAVTTSSIYTDIITDQAFREGVLRFHDAKYGESVTFFLEALNHRPGDARIHAWLGRAYFHAGFEDVAYKQWEIVNAAGTPSPALQSFMEYVITRQNKENTDSTDQKFEQVHATKNTSPVVPLFRRPTSVIPLPGGLNLVSSFGTSAIVVMDSNGKIIRSIRGGFKRFQGPFGMTLVDGKRLYVTQFLSDEVLELNLDGTVINRFGAHGIKDGQFSGPQYITHDDKGFVYISDIGNMRISKFDLDGNFVLSFGQASDNFAGLRKPTGIVYAKDGLWVIDARKEGAQLLKFDASGNLIDSLIDNRFQDIEGLNIYNENELLMPAMNTIYAFDMNSSQFRELHTNTQEKSRYTNIIEDINGNLLAVNFDNEEIEILSRLEGVYSGLHVQVQRINADKFPYVEVQLAITDNTGRPILGLDEDNFVLNEEKGTLKDLRLISAGFKSKTIDSVVMVENSDVMRSFHDNQGLENLITDIFTDFGENAHIAISSMGATPSLESPLNGTVKTAQVALRQMSFDSDWAFDRGLRFAVPQLVKTQGLKHIIFVSTGKLPENAFESFGLQETLAFLRNNQIRFSVINMSESPIDQGLAYLVKESGGQEIARFQPSGIQGLGRKLFDSREGSYTFSFTSSIDSDLGRKYLPLEVEVHQFVKSGRDEIGYFAPASFADGTRN